MYVSSAARYQNELAGVEAEQLAERFYHQALSVMPHVGEWLMWDFLTRRFAVAMVGNNLVSFVVSVLGEWQEYLFQKSCGNAFIRHNSLSSQNKNNNVKSHCSIEKSNWRKTLTNMNSVIVDESDVQIANTLCIQTLFKGNKHYKKYIYWLSSWEMDPSQSRLYAKVWASSLLA